MAIESWMRVPASDITPDYVRNFIGDHGTLNKQFDTGRATSSEHAAALEQLSALYGLVMKDGGLDTADRSSLSNLMTGANASAVDAYWDNALAANYGTGIDPGYYNPADAEAGTKTLEDATARQGAATPATTAAAEPQRAADGRIIYDAAPSFESVRTGEAALGLGQKSEEIRDMQRALFEGGHFEGLYDKGTSVDDIADSFFGPKTEQALKRWQEANGQQANGSLSGAALDQMLGRTPTVSTGGANPSAQVTTGGANPSAQVTTGGANPSAQVTTGSANPSAQVTTGSANPSAQVTTGTANPSAQVTTGTANPSAQVDDVGDGWWASPQGDGLDGFDVGMDFFTQDRADVFYGTTEDATIRNNRGRVVADGATNHGIGAEYNATVAGLEANLGDSQGTGIDGRWAIEADAYLGAEVSHKWEDGEGAIAGRAGAYAGVDATTEYGWGARYFGFGAKHTAGTGAGAMAEGHASYEDGRASIGGFAKGGWGATVGSGAEVWVDFGQMKEDWNSVTESVGNWFSGLDLSRD